MATIKSYTDIEQSKVLSKILPLETADMFYNEEPEDETYPKELVDTEYPMVIREGHKPCLEEYGIPCWSLASLLSVIPKHIDEFNVLRIDLSTNDFAIWYDEIGFGVNNDLPDVTMESAVDACVEMIIRLHELKML